MVPSIFLSSLLAQTQLVGVENRRVGVEHQTVVQLGDDGLLPWDLNTSGFKIISFSGAVLGKLLSLDPKLSVVPELLSEAYFDFEKKNYILKMRENLKFHSGRKVSIEDLEFSLVRFFYTHKRADQIAFLRNIVGVDSIKPGIAHKPWSTNGIQKINDHTLSVKLKKPNPAFLISLTEGWISLVPKEALEKDYVTWTRYPIGAGPFQVESQQSSAVQLTRFNDYWNSDFSNKILNRIFIQFSKAEQPDLVIFSDPPKTDQENYEKILSDLPEGFTGLFFNSHSELGRDLGFRNFIRDCFWNLQGLPKNDGIFPTHGILTRTQLGFYNVSPPTEVLNQSRSFRANGLKINGILFSGSDSIKTLHKEVGKFVEDRLKIKGVNVRWVGSTTPTFSEKDKDVVFRMDDRGTAFGDPLVIFSAFSKGGFLSPFFTGSVAKFEKILHRAEMAQTLEERAQSLKDLSQFFLDESIVVPFYERKKIFWKNRKSPLLLGNQNGASFDLTELRWIR